jgi:hypothetical protein
LSQNLRLLVDIPGWRLKRFASQLCSQYGGDEGHESSQEFPGSNLFEKAFRSGRPKPLLHWNKLDTGERQGRVNLFTGAYMAHRNPRGHREFGGSRARVDLTEFLLLNHLYQLERESDKS